MKDKLCRELPTVMTDVKKAQLQSDLHSAQIKVDELQKEVSSATQPGCTLTCVPGVYLSTRYLLALVHVCVSLRLSL